MPSHGKYSSYQPNISLNSTFFTDNITLEYSWAPNPIKYPDLQLAKPANSLIYLPHGAYSYDKLPDPLEVWYFETSKGRISFTNPIEPPLLSWYQNNSLNLIPEKEMEFFQSSNLFSKSKDSSDRPIIAPLTFKLEKNKRYQVILLSFSGQQHPWHLHGYQVEMIGVGYLQNLIKSSKEIYSELLQRYPLNQTFPILTVTDTWLTPPQGYSVFRFTANRLGPWLFHCHVEWHLSQGMTLLFSVENSLESGKSKYEGINPPPENLLIDCLINRKILIKSDLGNKIERPIQTYLILIISGLLLGMLLGMIIMFSYHYRVSRNDQYKLIAQTD